MFPIRSVKGEVIGFGGRVLGDEKPKYLNSPETPVFHKGHELYGLFEARTALREHGYALVTEGYMDVVALAQLGFGNAVATLGTACTPEHVQKLFRFTDSVVFGFDGDAAGRRAARKALEAALPWATDVRSVKFLFLPPEHDPDSFIRAEGADAFAAAVKAAMPLSRFLLDAAAEACDLSTAEGRSHFAANARPLWQLLPAGALAQQLLGDIATQVQIGTHELEALWGLRRHTESYKKESWPRARDERKTPKTYPNAAAPRPAGRVRVPPASRASRAAQIVLTEPALWDSLSQAEQALLCDLPAPHGALFTWLAGQVLEHGPQPWAVLQQALLGHELQAVAQQLAHPQHDGIEPSAADLRDILQQEHEALIKRQMDAALAAGDTPHYQLLTRELAGLKRRPPSRMD
jgi:DNA primase